MKLNIIPYGGNTKFPFLKLLQYNLTNNLFYYGSREVPHKNIFYLVITRNFLAITTYVSRNYEKLSRNYEKLSRNYEKLSRNYEKL